MIRKKRLRIYLFGLILLFVTVLVLSPFIYIPPALNDEIMNEYVEWIQIAKTTQTNWVLKVRNTKDFYLRIEDEFSPTIFGENSTEIENYFPNVTSDKYQHLVHNLVKINCCRITKNDQAIYFVIRRRLFPPRYRAGVAYSLSGSELVHEKKIHPTLENIVFTKLTNNWYVSKDLLLIGRRLDIQYSLPSSLLDYSMSRNYLSPAKSYLE